MKVGAVFILGFLYLVLTPMVSGVYVPHSEEWGIYRFDVETGDTELVYSSPFQITNIDLSPDKSRFALVMYHGDGYEYSEIYTLNVDGTGLTRLTDNDDWDLYPNWSPDGSEILFLSWRDTTLDIYLMDSDGGNQRLLYDSGGHDSDIDWVGTHIVFTRDSQIWMMNSGGSDVHQLTDPPDAGIWGDSVLPFGDYDPRISPDGSIVVFERLVDDSTQHGNYDLYVIGADGVGEHNITGTGWTQGIAQWSSTGEQLIFLVSAVGVEGRYDIHRVNVDSSGAVDLTSELLPPGFLVHHTIYAEDDSTLYFVGQWWNWEILDTEITCTVSDTTVSLSESVTVSVAVQPEVHTIEAILTITDPDGTANHQTVTLYNGANEFSYTPEQLGTYSVHAEWNGDLGHTGSISDFVSFTVQEAAPPSEGIPGYPLVAIILGFFVYLVWCRQSYQRNPPSIF